VRWFRFGHREVARTHRDGDNPGKISGLFPRSAKQCQVKSAILRDSTVSGGFWEERNAKDKVNETIKIHVEWAVSDFGHVKK
jgi:hypothetical protein